MLKKNKKVNDFEKSNLTYFKEIGKFKPLSLEEELSLWKDYKYNNNIDARNKLITSNLKFVTSIAQGYKGRGLSLSDLIAEGNVGLMKAIDKFDANRGYKIISYSVWWIRQTILEAIKKRNGIEGEELPSEIADVSGQSEFNIGGEESDFKADIPLVFVTNDTENELSRNEQLKAISLVMSPLTDREKFVVTNYYGLNGEEPKTLEAIGKEIGLTKERIRQINEKALTKMRTEMLKNYITADIYR